MNNCYLVRIWRRVGIDLLKIWLIYREEKEDIVLSENVDKLLKFVVDGIIPELNKKLWNAISRKLGEEILNELKLMEDEMILYGNYDTHLEPIIAYEYLWWEILAGLFDKLPPKLEGLVTTSDTYREKKEFGNLFKKSLVNVEHEKYPIKLHYGIYVSKTNECTID